jgi:maltooligosyltrehalose trehalohydrolase
MRIGAWIDNKGECTFTVWAPLMEKLQIIILSQPEYTYPMVKNDLGYWSVTINKVKPHDCYRIKPNGDKTFPDPASHSQPLGVHGPSEIVDHNAFTWNDRSWRGIALEKMILYEIHIGCFTPEGTFAAAQNRLQDLKDLGINTIEIMPIAAFPGERNWGYDGVYPYAVQKSYGKVDDFKAFIDACHAHEIAVILDVVYNHLGPEGNYLNEFAPYFSKKYNTSWGWAINYDDRHSGGVRNFFIENALYWLREFHIDGLRLDAIHSIFDASARPFLFDLAQRVNAFGEEDKRKRLLIAESDLNDARVVRPVERFGLGIDGQWVDDFHHALHALLTSETTGYYADFGSVSAMAKAFSNGYVYTRQYSRFRKRDHGNSPADIALSRFVVSSQNHDQVGNRVLGERLTALVSFEACKLAAAAVLLAPCIPLLFMGEEYNENSPFLYFADHSDPELIEGVRKGRAAEFLEAYESGHAHDPFAPETFTDSKIHWEKRTMPRHSEMLLLYKKLIALRQECSALGHVVRPNLTIKEFENSRLITLKRWHEGVHALCIFNFGPLQSVLDDFNAEAWTLLLDTADKQWLGPGPAQHRSNMLPSSVILQPWSAIVLKRTL